MKKGLILCLALVMALALVAQARIIGSTKISKRGEATVLVPEKISPKALGTADSIGNVAGGANDLIWRVMSGPGGRNLGEDVNHNLVSLYARPTGLSTNIGVLVYGASNDGGVTWASSDLFPGEQLRRLYSAVAVDGQGWPHFACQAASAPYAGFELRYCRDEGGIGAGLVSTYVTLNDTTVATGTTPYNPNIVVNGPAGENIWVSASDYSGVYAGNSDDSHMGYRSIDGAATWEPLAKWFNPTSTDPNYATVDGPAMCVSDNGQHLFSIVNAGQCVVGADTLSEVPFFYYSNDSGATWQFGGALNTADTTVPRTGLSYVAGGWWHIGSTAMDHNGIVHVVWSSNGSQGPNTAAGYTDTLYHDPLIHSYNTTPYDYTSWIHEEIGNAAVYDTLANVYTGQAAFSTVSINATNDMFVMFCDVYDTTGFAGVWGQLKTAGGTLCAPVLLNTIDGINIGSWIEAPQMLVDDTVHVTWGKGGNLWSNVTALMHSYATKEQLGVAGNPPVSVTTHSFVLNQSRPNPFRTNANISFSLPKAGTYSLKVYNIAGQVVRTLDGKGNAGQNTVTWNARDNSGREVANGVYLYNLNAFGNSATKKLVVVR